jgi:two-component system chemotaxis response regulator CheB
VGVSGESAITEQLVRVLVVDDSAFMRRALTMLINAGRGLTVVGNAANGREALTQIAALKPDVVTMDVEMPEMDGVQALAAVMARHPLPVVMLSSLTLYGAEITLRCLELGAVDFLAKPSGSVTEDLSSVRYSLWKKLRDAAHARVQAPSRLPTVPSPAQPPVAIGPRRPASRLVAIGASTGGPRALQEVLLRLPGDLPAGLIIVQHMPAQFTAAMAQRFDTLCALTVREACDDMRPEDGVAIIARGGQHLHIAPTGKIHLTDEAPVWAVRPAVDPMLRDVATLRAVPRLGVILTGMGRDGADGLALLKASGGMTLAQNEASSVVYGMPRAAVQTGAVDCVLPLEEIAGAIIAWCRTGTLPVGEEHA